MRLSGSNMNTFEAEILPQFDVQTDLALNWLQAADGNWSATDRGASYDRYRSAVTFHGLQGTCEKVVEEINNNRTGGDNQVTLDYFDSNEKIFGADLDYTGTFTTTVLNTPKIVQAGLKYYTVDVEFQIVGSPSFDGTLAGTLPSFSYLDKGYDANVDEYTITKHSLYDRSFSYIEHEADAGVFIGTFNFSDTEMGNLREYYRTNRDGNVTITAVAGVDELFGPIRAGSYSYTVKILDIQERSMWGISRWITQVKFAEVV